MPVPGFDDGMAADKDSRRGWNRAAIQYRSAKPYKPNIKIDDLLMPSGLGNFRMFRTCVLMAAAMSVLYVWIPLRIFKFFVPISGVAYAATMGGAFLILTAFLYLWGTRETRRDRELATRL